jgi:hypothetical protein
MTDSMQDKNQIWKCTGFNEEKLDNSVYVEARPQKILAHVNAGK